MTDVEEFQLNEFHCGFCTKEFTYLSCHGCAIRQINVLLIEILKEVKPKDECN